MDEPVIRLNRLIKEREETQLISAMNIILDSKATRTNNYYKQINLRKWTHFLKDTNPRSVKRRKKF